MNPVVKFLDTLLGGAIVICWKAFTDWLPNTASVVLTQLINFDNMVVDFLVAHNMTRFDTVVMSMILGIFISVVIIFQYALYRVTSAFVKKLRAILNFPLQQTMFAVTIDPTQNYRVMEAIPVEPSVLKIVPEGAFAKDTVQVVRSPPDSIFIVIFLDEEGRRIELGHGFVCENKLWTAKHIFQSDLLERVDVRGCKFYIMKPNTTKMIEVELGNNLSGRNSDYVELLSKRGNAQAALGLKSEKFGLYVKRAVTVFTRTGSDYVYQYVAPLQLAELSLGNPVDTCHIIATRTNTKPSDSGLPVMQNGKVVAMHFGRYEGQKVNIHMIPYKQLKAQIRAKNAECQPIFTDIKVAVFAEGKQSYQDVSSLHKPDDDGRDKHLFSLLKQEEFDEREANSYAFHREQELDLDADQHDANIRHAAKVTEQIRRAAGEHEDDQGFFQKKDWRSGFSWAEAEDEEDEIRKKLTGEGAMDKAAKSHPNAQAPASGAQQMPQAVEVHAQQQTKEERKLQAKLDETRSKLQNKQSELDALKSAYAKLLKDSKSIETGASTKQVTSVARPSNARKNQATSMPESKQLQTASSAPLKEQH